MTNQQLYQQWLCYKVKRRILTEKKIKGKCSLKERHWKMLERTWFQQFIGDGEVPRSFIHFVSFYPSIKDKNIVKIARNFHRSMISFTQWSKL